MFKNTSKVIKRLRAEAKMTQAQLGNKLELHSQYVHNVEVGKCFFPKTKIKKLMKVLKIELPERMEIAKALEEDFRLRAHKNYKEFFGY